MVTRFLLILGLLSFTSAIFAQKGTFYGVKGGLTLGNQKWDSFERDALVGYHIILSMESMPVQEKFSLFAQLGYHVKGSSLRPILFGIPFNASSITAPPRKFEFYNISFSVGAKQVFKNIGSSSAYYLFGIRGDYTMDTNLDDYSVFIDLNPSYAGIYPIDSYTFIQRINYGAIAGGGINFPFSDYVQGVLEFTVNPDFSLQYQQPAINNVIDPFNGQTRTIPERNIRNITFEITLGARFLREIEYVD